jgi:hypothetical protein
MKRFLYLGAVLFLLIICLSCGEVFRPIIIPNPPKFPNPAAAHSVLIISDNGTVSAGVETPIIGNAMSIDVAGDTDMSQRNIGLVPVHAVQLSANQVFVANQSAPGANQDSLSRLVFSGTTIANVSTISLPFGSAPNFLATTEANTVYVSMPGYSPPSIAVVNTAQSAITHIFAVGLNPVAMTETPDIRKLYVANYGDGTIGGFNPQDQSPRIVCVNSVCPVPPVYTLPLSSPPIWLAARNDSQRVYVLEQNGTLAYIDTTVTAGPDYLYESYSPQNIQVPGATYFWYDVILNRLYIPGQGLVNGALAPAVTIVDVSQSVPTTLAVVPIPAFSPLNLPAVPATAIAVTSLPDATRAYVGSYAVLPTNLTISSVSGDGTNATYTYTLTSGHDLTPGAAIAVSGLVDSMGNPLPAFEGTFQVSNVLSATTACPSNCFQVPNVNVLGATAEAGTGAYANNIFPQVTVINATNFTVKTNIAIPGFPDASDPGTQYYVPVCATTRDQVGPMGNGFRMMMAAGGDSTRAYLSTCDGGTVNIIQTATDTYYFNLPAAYSARAPIPPSNLNPPQNPVFMIAGP